MRHLNEIVKDFVKEAKPQRNWREVEEEFRRRRDPRLVVSLPHLRFLELGDEAA
jgi:hypothetical protein